MNVIGRKIRLIFVGIATLCGCADNTALNKDLNDLSGVLQYGLPERLLEDREIIDVSVIENKLMYKIVIFNRNEIALQTAKVDAHRDRVISFLMAARNECRDPQKRSLLERGATFEYMYYWGGVKNFLYEHAVKLSDCDYVEKSVYELMVNIAQSFNNTHAKKIDLYGDNMYVLEEVVEEDKKKYLLNSEAFDDYHNILAKIVCTDLAYASIIYRGGSFIFDYVHGEQDIPIRHAEVNISTCEKLKLE